MLRPYIGPEEVHTISMLDHGLHCPRCTAELADDGFSSAYWSANATVYFCFCHECAWMGDISEFSTVTMFETGDPVEGIDF